MAEAPILNTSRYQDERPVDLRFPEELRAEGMTYKGFMILPSISVEGKYDSNILAESEGEKSDYIVSVRPTLDLRRQIAGHNFMLRAAGDIKRFASRAQENVEDFYGTFRGLFVGNSKWLFPIGANYHRFHRKRSAPTRSDLTEEPTLIEYYDAYGSIVRRFNRLSVELEGRYGGHRAEDGISIDTGQLVTNRDEDANIMTTTLGFYYEFPEGRDRNNTEHILFATLRHKDTDYLNPAVSNDARIDGASRDNQETGFLLGFETDYKGLLFGSFGVGAFQRKFDSSVFETTEDFDFEADIKFNLTPKLTLKGMAKRDVVQDNDFARGYLYNYFAFGADYELQHNFYLDTLVGYGDYEFDSENDQREDISASASLKYIHSRNLTSSVGVEYFERGATDPNNEFDRLMLMLRLTGQL